MGKTRNVANNLNIPVDVYLKFDKRNKVPAIKPETPGGNHRSKLKKKGVNGSKKPLRKITANDEVKLIFEMKKLPNNGDVQGVKVALGEGDDISAPFVPHHFEFIKKGEDKYWAAIHFKDLSQKNNKDKLLKLLEDEDPNTQHPGGG